MGNCCSPGCRLWCLWWCLFVLSFFPRGVLDEILNLIESVSEGFPSYSSRGQCHLVTLAKSHMSVVCQHLKKASSLKLLDLFELNFICSLLANGKRKFIFFVQVTVPRWSPWPYMVKTLKNLLLQNHWADCLETWYEAPWQLVL